MRDLCLVNGGDGGGGRGSGNGWEIWTLKDKKKYNTKVFLYDDGGGGGHDDDTGVTLLLIACQN